NSAVPGRNDHRHIGINVGNNFTIARLTLLSPSERCIFWRLTTAKCGGNGIAQLAGSHGRKSFLKLNQLICILRQCLPSTRFGLRRDFLGEFGPKRLKSCYRHCTPSSIRPVTCTTPCTVMPSGSFNTRMRSILRPTNTPSDSVSLCSRMALTTASTICLHGHLRPLLRVQQS